MLDDLRRSPATATLAILWVLVFAMMQVRQGAFSWGPNPFAIGAVETSVSHQFGDATSIELRSGQLWRAVTSTFIHYSLIHLALNLFGLLELGLLLEDRYGSGPFLAICLLIGGLGNLLAGLARPSFGIPPQVHSGGGSTIIFGLIGLCAVAGLRSKTEEGRDLGVQMLIFLGLNVLIGLAIPLLDRLFHLHLPSLDNLAHASGTLVGAWIGLAHRRLAASAERTSGRVAGGVAAVVLVACMAGQTWANRAEIADGEQRAFARARQQAAQVAVEHLLQLDILYRLAFLRGRNPSPELETLSVWVEGAPSRVAFQVPPEDQIRADLGAALRTLRTDESILADPVGGRAYRRTGELALRATQEPPTSLRVQEFESYLSILVNRVQAEAQAAVAALEAKGEAVGTIGPRVRVGDGPVPHQGPAGPAASEAPGS